MTRIKVQVADEVFDAELDEDAAPQTVQKILDALPIESVAKTWGDEIYFDIPVTAGPENPHEKVSKGDLGYWPVGEAFCIFFGKTPMSRSEDEIIPASPVNLIGRIENPDALKKHRAGETVRIEAGDQGALTE